MNALVGDVIATRPSKLSFSQLQNFIAEVAIERNHTHYFWGHADVAVMASNATAMHSAEVLGCAPILMQGSMQLLGSKYPAEAANEQPSFHLSAPGSLWICHWPGIRP